MAVRKSATVWLALIGWHAVRVIHSRTCVMILSDGYDTGAPDVLGAEIAALRRR